MSQTTTTTAQQNYPYQSYQAIETTTSSLPTFQYSFSHPQQQHLVEIKNDYSTNVGFTIASTNEEQQPSTESWNYNEQTSYPPPHDEATLASLRPSKQPEPNDEFYLFCQTLNAAVQESKVGTQRRLLLCESNDSWPREAAKRKRLTFKGEITPQKITRSPTASAIKRALLSSNGARVLTYGLDVVTLLRTVYGPQTIRDNEIPLLHTDVECVRAIVERVLQQRASSFSTMSFPPSLTFNTVYRAVRSLRFGDHETRVRVFRSLMNRATELETQWLIYLLCGCGPLQRTADMYVTAYTSNIHSWLKITRQRYLRTVQEFRTYWNADPYHIMISIRPRGTRRYQLHYERSDLNDISDAHQSTKQNRSKFATRAANGAKISIFGLQHTGFINVSFTVINELASLLAPVRNAIIEIDHFTTQQTRSSFIRSDVDEYCAMIPQLVSTCTNTTVPKHILCHCITIQDCYLLNDRDMRDLSIVERTRCLLTAIDRSISSTSVTTTDMNNVIWANDKCDPNSLYDHATIAKVLSSLYRLNVLHSSAAREHIVSTHRKTKPSSILRLIDRPRINVTDHRSTINESMTLNDICVIASEDLSDSTINSYQAFRVMMAGINFDRYFISLRIFRQSYYVKDVKTTLRRPTDETRFVPCTMAIVAGWVGGESDENANRFGPILLACRRSRRNPIMDNRVWRANEWLPICIAWNAFSDEEKRILLCAFTPRQSIPSIWCYDYIAKYFPDNPPQVFVSAPSCFVTVKFSNVCSNDDIVYVQWPIAYDLQFADTEIPRNQMIEQVIDMMSLRAFSDL